MTSAAILKLQRAGFSEPQVEALAEFLDAQMATKADVADLKLGIEKMRSDLELKISAIDVKIAETKSELVKWVVGVGFAQVAMLIAVLRLFPGAHP